MRTVRVYYRQEQDGAWIGTSPDVPGYVGHGESFEEAVSRTNEGLPWFAEEEVCIAHVRPPREGEPPRTQGPRVTFAITREQSARQRRFTVLPVGPERE
jgi:predicted RNase H-like HicB family nuclease